MPDISDLDDEISDDEIDDLDSEMSDLDDSDDSAGAVVYSLSVNLDEAVLLLLPVTINASSTFVFLDLNNFIFIFLDESIELNPFSNLLF